MVGELVTLEPSVLDSDKMIDSLVVNDALPVIEREMTSVVGVSVDSGVDEGVKVGELLVVTVLELLNVEVSEGVGSALDVILALAPEEMVDGGVGEDEGDWEGVGDVVSSDEDNGDCQGDGVSTPVGESLDDGVCVSVNELVSELELVAVGVSEELGVCDALAPRVTVVVVEGVPDAVSVADSVADAVDCELSSGLILTSVDALKAAVAVVMDDGNGALV